MLDKNAEAPLRTACLTGVATVKCSKSVNNNPMGKTPSRDGPGDVDEADCRAS